jgi:beta-glucosidase
VRELLKTSRLAPATVDQRVREVLSVKFRLGLFDQPYVPNPRQADKTVHTPADDAFALQVNRESLVLLKNADKVLPLNKNAVKNIFITGPLANSENYAISRYGPSNLPVTTVLKGLQAYAGASLKVEYEQGCDVTSPAWPDTELVPTPLSATEQQGIAQAVAKAKAADVIVAVLGEDDKTVGESLSRTALDLPGRQQLLLEALYATGKPVVLVLINGQPLTINWPERNVPAILEAWFPSPSGGRAIAETLFGDHNPGGKLPITFPKSVGQIEFNFPFKPAPQADQPIGGDPNGGGKTATNGPLYPFGFGLIYSSFGYSNLQISPREQAPQGQIEVAVDVANAGPVPGDEVVQLYLRDKLSSVITYDSQLRGFERVSLAPGEKKTVHFTLRPDDLALLDRNMNWVVEPGQFEVLIGSSSVDIRAKDTFDIKAK